MTRRVVLACAGGALLLVAAFFAGRYAVPQKVVETTRDTYSGWIDARATSWSEAKANVKSSSTAHTTRKIHSEKKPDGSEVTDSEEVEEETAGTVDLTVTASGSAAQTTGAAAETVERVKVVESPQPGWRLAVTAGWEGQDLTLRPVSYGVEVDRRIAGTLWLGVWGNTERQAGLALAMEW